MADEVESVKSSGKSDFLDKFRGKTNKISKLGVNAILLKGSIENMEADLLSLKLPQDLTSSQRLAVHQPEKKRNSLPALGESRNKSCEKLAKTKNKPEDFLN